MESSFLKRILLIGLVLVFNYFFWSEGLGINLFIFSVLIFTSLYLINRKSFSYRSVILMVISTLVLSGLVVYNNTLLTKFMYFAFLITSLGFIHVYEIKTIMAALPTGLVSFFMFPYTAITEIKHLLTGSVKVSVIWRKVRLAVIPLLILIVFYVIYINANPIFAEASDYVWAKVDNIFVTIFMDFPFVRMMFILLGLVIMSGFIYNWDIDVFRQKEMLFRNDLTRKYNPFNRYTGGFKMLSLVNEMRSAVILLLLINILIAVLNFIDIRYVWFGFEYYKGFDIRQFVHEGTYYLILSILLSMGIMLYYFRRNLNFFSENKWMKRLAYLWIFQNGIMAISVGVRNFYYIYYSHILAYKRIGLILFLIMVFIGLITLYLKIRKRYTIFYLLKVNFISVYTVLFIACFFSWGPIIAEFNLSNPDKEEIEYEFIVELSDETLPILDKNRDLLDRELIFYEGFSRVKINGIDYFLGKEDTFMKNYEENSWLSWNYSDWKTYEYFKKKPDYSLLKK